MTPFEYLLIFFAVTGVLLGGGILLSQMTTYFIEAFEEWLKER